MRVAPDRPIWLRRPQGGDWIILGLVAVAGLVVWVLYLGIQPHDYSRATGAPNYFDTIFGWTAPHINRSSFSLPDRSWITYVGWAAVSAAAGWARGRLSFWIGVATVLPAWLVYIPTAPRDIEGMWGLGVVLLPVLALVAGCVAALSAAARTRLRSLSP